MQSALGREASLAVARGRQTSQRVVRPDFVVAPESVVRDLPDIGDRLKEVRV